MTAISANELKTRGVAAIQSALENEPEAAISVRGKVRYVVMPVEQFHHLRECELESALMQTRADLAAGRAVRESPEAHLERLKSTDEE
jgi:hypothetical protein